MKYSVTDLKKAVNLITKSPHDDNILIYVDNATNFLMIKYNDNTKAELVQISIPPAESGHHAKVMTTERL